MRCQRKFLSDHSFLQLYGARSNNNTRSCLLLHTASRQPERRQQHLSGPHKREKLGLEIFLVSGIGDVENKEVPPTILNLLKLQLARVSMKVTTVSITEYNLTK